MPDSMTAAPVLDHAFVVAIARTLEAPGSAAAGPRGAPRARKPQDEVAVDARTLREFATAGVPLHGLWSRQGLAPPEKLDEVLGVHRRPDRSQRGMSTRFPDA